MKAVCPSKTSTACDGSYYLAFNTSTIFYKIIRNPLRLPTPLDFYKKVLKPSNKIF